MKIFKLDALWSLVIVASLATACSQDKNASENQVSSQDIVNAVELTFPETKIPEVNAGFGNVLEVNSEGSTDNMYFAKEENSEWLYFKATESGNLAFVLKPEESGKDFNFIVFKKTGTDFAKEVQEKHILPLRSNLSKGSGTGYDSTGLDCSSVSEFEGVEGTSLYSKALQVEKDSNYYICVNHAHSAGKGYSIRLYYCGEGQSEDTMVADTTATTSLEEATPPPTLPNKPAPVATSKPKGGYIAPEVSDLGPDEEYYIVEQKNTVYSISTSHDMKVIELLSRNRLTNNNIFVGQRLIVRKKGSAPRQELVSTPEPKPQPVSKPQAAPKEEVKEETPAVAQEPAPKVKIEEPSGSAANEEVSTEYIAPLETRASVPKSTGTPAAPASLEAKNAVPEATQKLWLYINVVNAKNNNPVNTIVQVIDGANNKKVDRVPSNQLTYVPIYAAANRKKIFVIDAFSFRKESFELDLDNLRNDSAANQIALVNDTVVLNFELERYRKKDIFAAYNIFFYDDASVMLPKSKYELESLLEMLKENPKVAIRIHGHTNSSSMGKIISLEPGDKEFFRLTAKNKEGFGTAVMLSKRRAESIKYYLEFNGIKAPRLDIKGWGGKKMIYDRDVPLAHKNKRVEIEILED
jgi:outer membrane protein OmpA-like peptidoglycan-associated protein